MAERSEYRMAGGDAPEDHNPQERIWEEAFDWVYALDRATAGAGVDAATSEAFEDWLARGPERRRAYEAVRRVWQAAPAMAPTLAAEPETAAENVVPLAERRRAPDPGRRRWLLGAGGLAAGIALFAVSGGLDLLRADYATAVGETREIVLPDGSRVVLDSDSALALAFDDGRRGVTLQRGRAWFEVTPDSARPFVVAAGPAEVRVLGTRFDVGLGEGRLEVAVAEGRVAVGEQELVPGQRLTLDLESGAARLAEIDPDSVAAWRRGRLVVEDWPVARVLEELGRYHRGAILLRDPVLGERRVSGFYDLTRPVEAVRSAVEAQGGRVTALGPWLLVVTGS